MADNIPCAHTTPFQLTGVTHGESRGCAMPFQSTAPPRPGITRSGPIEALAVLLECPPYAVGITGFSQDWGVGSEQLRAVLDAVPHVKAGQPDGDTIFSPMIWRQLAHSARTALERFHAAFPQLMGLGIVRMAEALEPRLPEEMAVIVVRALIADGTLAANGGAIHLPGHRLALDRHDHRLWQRILPMLSGEHRFRPPQGRECAEYLGERELDIRRVLKAMARQQGIVELAPDRFFLRETVREMGSIAVEIADGHQDGSLTAAQFRDRLQNGRRMAVEILEFFDREGLTTREGDLRRVSLSRVSEYAGTSIRF